MTANASDHRKTVQDTLNRKKDFLDLFGVWSDEELKEFNREVGDFEKIDRRLGCEENRHETNS